MIAMHLLLFFVGFILLYCGAEWLVKGASNLAKSLGVTPIVIGLTVVAFGTSTPEFFVSLISSINGRGMIAIGSVIGSNICNIAMILGLTAIFNPLTCDKSVIKRDIPIMLGISLLLIIFSMNSVLGRIEGAFLIIGIILYTCFNYYIAGIEKKDAASDQILSAELEVVKIDYIISRSKQLLFIFFGVTGVLAGAQIVVESSIKAMNILGLNEKFIAITIIAFGTSLPELITSVIAAIRNEMGISVGNLVGSNVFNLLGVLGAASLISPISIPDGFHSGGLYLDYLIMFFTSFLPWLMMRKSLTLARNNGRVLIGCYAGYLAYLIANI